MLKANAEYIKEKCSKITFKPTDEQELEEFLKKEKEAKEAPLDKYFSKLEEKKAAEEMAKLETAADENMFTESTANVGDAEDGFIPDAKSEKEKKGDSAEKGKEKGSKRTVKNEEREGAQEGKKQEGAEADAEIGDFSDLTSDAQVDDKARDILSKLGYADTKLDEDGGEDGGSGSEEESDFDEAEYDVYEEGEDENGKGEGKGNGRGRGRARQGGNGVKVHRKERHAPRKGAKKSSK